MKTITRRAFLKKGLRFSLYGLITTGIGYYYARYIEPAMLSVSRHTIRSPLIPKGFDGLKVIQFSDLHLGYHYPLQNLPRIIDKINEQQPDVVFFTGDLFDDQREFADTSEVVRMLLDIQAPHGKLCIYGNHDHGGYGTETYKAVMKDAGFTMLQNSEHRIRLLDGSEISVLGVDDLLLGYPDLHTTMNYAQEDIYTIALIHEPDIAPAVAGYPVDLLLSGHSHGGQVQIPFLGPVITPPLARTYVEGFYTVQGNEEHELTLYVNRGLGMTRVPFRCFSRPELTVFTLKRST